MVISDTTKTDRLFKESQDRRMTSTDKAFYEEEAANLRVIQGEEVWLEQIDSDPATAIAAGTAWMQSGWLHEDSTVADEKAWFASGTNDNSGYWRRWIPPKVGQDYTISVYKSGSGTPGVLGAKILTTDVSDWVFDYQEGMLWFQDAPGYSSPYYISGYRYSGALTTKSELDSLYQASGTGGGSSWSGATGYIIVSSQAHDAYNWINASSQRYEDILSSGVKYTWAYKSIDSSGIKWTWAYDSIDASGNEYSTAYTHSQDNTQAHSDYLLNNEDDSTSGTITAKSFSGPLSGTSISGGSYKGTWAGDSINLGYVDSGSQLHNILQSGNKYTIAYTWFDESSQKISVYVASGDSYSTHVGTTHDYAYITSNDGATDVTAAELEELSDGSQTTLHSHAGGAAGGYPSGADGSIQYASGSAQHGGEYRLHWDRYDKELTISGTVVATSTISSQTGIIAHYVSANASNLAGATDEKVKIDTGATADYIGAASTDGVLRTDGTISYSDGGDFVTLTVNDRISGSAVSSQIWFAASGVKLSQAYVSTSTGIFEPALTKGTLTSTSPIALTDSTRQLIGGASVISISNYIGSTQAIARFADSSNVNWTKITAISSGFDGRLDTLEAQQPSSWSGAVGYTNVSGNARDAYSWTSTSGTRYEDILGSGVKYTTAYNERGSQIAGDNLNWDGSELDVQNVLVDNADDSTIGTLTAAGFITTAFVSSQYISGSNLKIGATKITNILDEDDMSSDSNVSLATQQSIKKYVDDNASFDATLYATSANIIDRFYPSAEGHFFTGSGAKLASAYASASTGIFEPALTKGNLTASSPLSLDNTRQVIGGAAQISIPKGTASADGYLDNIDYILFSSAVLHSSNSSLHSFNVANYITSTNSISRFAPSSETRYGWESVANAGTIAHTCSAKPTWVGISPSGANPIAYSFTVDATNVTVYHTSPDTETFSWRAVV